MTSRLVPTLLALLALNACTRPPARTRGATGGSGPRDASARPDDAPAASAPLASLPATAPDAGIAQLDPDGDDDDEDPGAGHAPASGHWEKVGTPPLALTRICDLTPLDGALYAAHANQPLGTDGATVTRYRPGATPPFTVAFDWNRPGEPTKGGGAGQGFLRVHAIGGRLYVPDADPPYGGLQQIDWGAEGYVFVSDPTGTFARPRSPHFRPPTPPSLASGSAGAAVLPRAYHVLDTIRFRGALYASTGSVPPKERAWSGPSPGALHRAEDDGRRWTYDVDYPNPWREGVWRLTYLVRFRDRLYAGIQDYAGRDPNDVLVIAPPRDQARIAPADLHPTRITLHGGSGTLRFWVDRQATPSRLYWLGSTREGVALYRTTDGDTWSRVPLPVDIGRPTDLTRFQDAIVLLAETGLYRLDPDAETATPIALVDGPPAKGPFALGDFMCAAPLAVLDGELYAGGQRGGALWRLAE